jgi:hypothetical protein
MESENNDILTATQRNQVVVRELAMTRDGLKFDLEESRKNNKYE